MKKIAFLACQMIRSKNLCPGDTKCLVALNRREGEFERYKGEDTAVLGIIECGECEGNRNRAVLSLGLLKMQLAALNETLDAIHAGTCIINFCPRKDDLLKAVKDKAGVEVVEGGHKYIPPTIF
ncbi:MAG: CGGC domain-containing protein [Nitrospirota bacterium]